jgi:hypothetical protein
MSMLMVVLVENVTKLFSNWIIRIVKYGRLWFAGHVIGMGEIRRGCRIYVMNRFEKRLFVRPSKCEDSIQVNLGLIAAAILHSLVLNLPIRSSVMHVSRCFLNRIRWLGCHQTQFRPCRRIFRIWFPHAWRRKQVNFRNVAFLRKQTRRWSPSSTIYLFICIYCNSFLFELVRAFLWCVRATWCSGYPVPSYHLFVLFLSLSSQRPV